MSVLPNPAKKLALTSIGSDLIVLAKTPSVDEIMANNRGARVIDTIELDRND